MKALGPGIQLGVQFRVEMVQGRGSEELFRGRFPGMGHML